MFDNDSIKMFLFISDKIKNLFLKVNHVMYAESE